MRIALRTSDDTTYWLAGNPAISEREHSSAGDLAVDAATGQQVDRYVRGTAGRVRDRGNILTTLRFSTTRIFATADAAALWALDHDASYPREGTLLIDPAGDGGIDRYLENAVISPPSRRIIGCSVLLSYTVTGGAVSSVSELAAFVLGSTYADSPGVLCTVPIPAAATAAGILSAMHPSVVYFPQGKGGYTYWMVQSPFRSGIQIHENPNIVASNDGVTWVVPAGVVNPIAPLPAGAIYQNDPALYWDAVDEQFICVWGRILTGGVNYNIMGMTSRDGVAWSAEFILLTKAIAAESWGSTAIMRRHDGLWMLMAVNNVPATSTIIYATAAANAFATGTWAGTWSATRTCTLDHVVSEPWHMDVRHYGSGYVMLLDEVDAFNRHQLLFLTSNDAAAWSIDRSFPYAIGWNGDPAFGSNYYKAGFVLGPWFGDGKIGRMWFTNASMDWIKVTDLAVNPASQLADTYLETAIAGAISHASPYVIGDRFERADGVLTGASSQSGHTWLSYIYGATVAAGKVSKIGANANGTGYLVYGAMDGVVGMRISTFPAAAEVSLSCRSKRAGTGSNSYAIVLNYAGSLWRIMYYVGGSWVYLATWAPAALDDGSYDGTEIVMEFRGLAIRVWMDGRLMASCVIPQAAYDTLAAAPNTQVGFTITDSATRIDRFFARG